MTDDEGYQQKFLRSLFAKDGDSVDGDDDDNDISEYSWICPQTSNISIIYHLAFLAPGHGDSIWNSSECIAQHLLIPQYRRIMFGDELEKRYHWPPSKCIEFGAGAALPSLALLKEGATQVVFTDRYVNEQTFDALRMSVDKNIILWGMSEEEVKKRVAIMGFTWGEDVEKLLIPDNSKECRHADLLIASDCIYNPTYHKALLQSAAATIDKEHGILIVGYSFHGNVPPSQTLNFFEVAKNDFGLVIINEFMKEYDGQKGIGNEDKTRGAVYVKVLADKDSIHCSP